MEIIINATKEEYDRANDLVFKLIQKKGVSSVRFHLVETINVRKNPSHETKRTKAMNCKSEGAYCLQCNEI